MPRRIEVQPGEGAAFGFPHTLRVGVRVIEVRQAGVRRTPETDAG